MNKIKSDISTKSLEINHYETSATTLLGIDSLSDNAFYNFEADDSPYEQIIFYSGNRERIDLIMHARHSVFNID